MLVIVASIAPFSQPITAPELEVEFVGNPCNNAFSNGKCDVCTGDCDRDSDCDGDLRCAKRDGRDGNDEVENVPGCVWGDGSEDQQDDDNDFCKLTYRCSCSSLLKKHSFNSSHFAKFIF